MRTLRLTAAALLGLVLLAVAPAAADDAQQIRELFQTHWAGWYAADLDKVLSTCAEDLVAYDAFGRPPHTWTVRTVGREAYREQIADMMVESKAVWDQHPERKRHDEVIHIDVNGDRALAVTYQGASLPKTGEDELVMNE